MLKVKLCDSAETIGCGLWEGVSHTRPFLTGLGLRRWESAANKVEDGGRGKAPGGGTVDSVEGRVKPAWG